MTRKELEQNFEKAILQGSGAKVEVTFFYLGEFSVITETEGDMQEAQRIMAQVPNAKLVDTDTCEGLYAAFYAF
jgi:uncharacterized protein with GYD domain